ncbi:hypothetical protein HZU75_08885 [Chitinibacter fontanus]|uniref:Cds6 C-terminal domain-containing protein n=1 Tax=Chitinibacter fontanus TaxID=1737446 RepID=A0A7D5V9U3_9NEIS|nr:hypothetical protein [Chitinibacter fontanus]QLI81636.1 hypothetical protein HZU75_08885 [Chitinibacter fontanus]
MKKIIACLCCAVALTQPVFAAESAEVSVPVLSQSEKSIYRLLDEWSQAWRSQSINQYLSFYASSFTPEHGLSLAQWRAQRQQRFFAADFVQIQIVNPKIIQLHGENASVQFTQNYRSSLLQDQTVKTLQLVMEAGQWKIARETTASQR